MVAASVFGGGGDFGPTVSAPLCCCSEGPHDSVDTIWDVNTLGSKLASRCRCSETAHPATVNFTAFYLVQSRYSIDGRLFTGAAAAAAVGRAGES